MYYYNGVLKERVQPLVEVFKKNTMEIINALLIYNRPLSHLSTAPTSLLRNACFSHWLKHIWKSHYPSGVIRGCHTDFFAERFYLFWGGGGGGGLSITSVNCVCALVRLVIS